MDDVRFLFNGTPLQRDQTPAEASRPPPLAALRSRSACAPLYPGAPVLAPLRPCAAPPLLDGPPLPSQAGLADGDVINTEVDLSINLKVIERRRYLPPDAAAGWQRIGEPSTHGGTADANRALGDAHSTAGVGNGEGAWEDGAEVFFKARAPPRPPACSQCRRPSLPLLPRRHLPCLCGGCTVSLARADARASLGSARRRRRCLSSCAPSASAKARPRTRSASSSMASASAATKRRPRCGAPPLACFRLRRWTTRDDPPDPIQVDMEDGDVIDFYHGEGVVGGHAHPERRSAMAAPAL